MGLGTWSYQTCSAAHILWWSITVSKLPGIAPSARFARYGSGSARLNSSVVLPADPLPNHSLEEPDHLPAPNSFWRTVPKVLQIERGMLGQGLYWWRRQPIPDFSFTGFSKPSIGKIEIGCALLKTDH